MLPYVLDLDHDIGVVSTLLHPFRNRNILLDNPTHIDSMNSQLIYWSSLNIRFFKSTGLQTWPLLNSFLSRQTPGEH